MSENWKLRAPISVFEYLWIWWIVLPGFNLLYRVKHLIEQLVGVVIYVLRKAVNEQRYALALGSTCVPPCTGDWRATNLITGQPASVMKNLNLDSEFSAINWEQVGLRYRKSSLKEWFTVRPYYHHSCYGRHQPGRKSQPEITGSLTAKINYQWNCLGINRSQTNHNSRVSSVLMAKILRNIDSQVTIWTLEPFICQ